MNDRIEILILKGLLHDEEYCRKVLPFLKEEYFELPSEKKVFDVIKTFITDHNNLPTLEAVSIVLNGQKITSEMYNLVQDTLKEITSYEKPDLDWFLDRTEKFCKEKSIINAFRVGIEIIDGREKTKSPGVLPDLMKDALSVSFNTSIGHSYTEDFDQRYSYYHTKEEQLPFDLECLNKITNGGVPKKTLNLCIAGCVHPDTKVKIRYRKRNAN